MLVVWWRFVVPFVVLAIIFTALGVWNAYACMTGLMLMKLPHMSFEINGPQSRFEKEDETVYWGPPRWAPAHQMYHLLLWLTFLLVLVLTVCGAAAAYKASVHCKQQKGLIREERNASLGLNSLYASTRLSIGGEEDERDAPQNIKSRLYVAAKQAGIRGERARAMYTNALAKAGLDLDTLRLPNVQRELYAVLDDAGIKNIGACFAIKYCMCGDNR